MRYSVQNAQETAALRRPISRAERPDSEEPVRVAMAARDMGLRYIVITSVTRDDLPDGGAEQFVKTINEARKYLPDSRVEVLTPDFNGNLNATL